MHFGKLLIKLNNVTRIQLRQLEKLKKQLIVAKWSKYFFEICHKNKLIPKHIKIKHRDQGILANHDSFEIKLSLLSLEINNCSNKISKLEQEINIKSIRINQLLSEENIETNLKNDLLLELSAILDKTNKAKEVETKKKIYRLQENSNKSINTGNNNRKCYVNLSDHELSKYEEEFLNLGLNFHVKNKYSKFLKKVNIEILYQDIMDLFEKNEIVIREGLANQLRAEAMKHRFKHTKQIISKELIIAANSLKNNKSIVIKKADKSSCYVILNTKDYETKLNEILKDDNKFIKIKRNKTEDLKKKANKLIDAANATQGDIKFSKIVGDYFPGYIYGNIKTHKENNPCRPIISQIPTPTYNLAKMINNIISPYIPKSYTVNSSSAFVDILSGIEASGTLASLDVESLFTNVPIDKTIDIIINRCYQNDTIKAPKIPQNILKEMLIICTKENIFRNFNGDLYQQIDGIAMGSPLGPSFANFYMGDLEDRLFKIIKKPKMYCRYIDDIFILADNINEIHCLKETFENFSVLKFSIELNKNNELPYLDVLINNDNNVDFKLNVYRKPTNNEMVLDGRSECPTRYKNSVINSFLIRANKICKSEEQFKNEIDHIKKMLINNNYCSELVNDNVKKFE